MSEIDNNMGDTNNRKGMEKNSMYEVSDLCTYITFILQETCIFFNWICYHRLVMIFIKLVVDGSIWMVKNKPYKARYDNQSL